MKPTLQRLAGQADWLAGQDASRPSSGGLGGVGCLLLTWENSVEDELSFR